MILSHYSPHHPLLPANQVAPYSWILISQKGRYSGRWYNANELSKSEQLDEARVFWHRQLKRNWQGCLSLELVGWYSRYSGYPNVCAQALKTRACHNMSPWTFCWKSPRRQDFARSSFRMKNCRFSLVSFKENNKRERDGVIVFPILVCRFGSLLIYFGASC